MDEGPKFRFVPKKHIVDPRSDRLNHATRAAEVANLIEKLRTPSCVTVSGPWGSGKTTFMNFIQSELVSRDVKCVWFNAWEYDATRNILEGLFRESAQVVAPLSQ